MYRIYYNDGTWMDYPELTDESVEAVNEGFRMNKTYMHAKKAKLTLSLVDIRAVRWIEDAPVENESYEPEMTAQEKEYIEGIRLAERLHAEMASKGTPSYSDYVDDEIGEDDI